ncbi:MAG: response regulator [Candidatus Latescibacteria bacterium]|nr:response regulator [Candidatus Latescibacterota bacterium]NIO29238.1 response regulator [Candidatus Latescibacterota bacterium]NIO56862.1 response regulator [Candidatus Latescibacterota bacterium]
MKTDKLRRVLIVDDESDFAALLESMFKELGFETQIAHNGEDALAMLDLGRPDIITLDIQMPNQSGILFYQQIKTIEYYAHIPVIVISGLPPKTSEWRRFMTAFLEGQRMPGPQAYLNKPVEKNDLEFTIKRVFRID